MAAPSEATAYGRYELIRRLDGGGMGEVFVARARGPERVQKTVVLKRMRPDRLSDESLRARFVEEARVAVSLSHPHIVPVFEFGELDGQYFLVMEWLRGGNLAAIAGPGKQPLPWTAAALVGSQICDALAYVHGKRNRDGAALVHGDVTPRNVLLSTDGHVLLADFGLARFAARGRAGTVRYLAPEQARGEAIDARADLYALALVLSEAVTGKPVYDEDLELAERQARAGAMPELDAVMPELAQVLRRALAAHPSGRFRDATAMREAFDAVLDREPRARAAGRTELIARTARANVDAQSLQTSLSRAESSVLATRDATRPAPPPRRWPLLASVLLVGLVAGVVAQITMARSAASTKAKQAIDAPTRTTPAPSLRATGPATPTQPAQPTPAQQLESQPTVAQHLESTQPAARASEPSDSRTAVPAGRTHRPRPAPSDPPLPGSLDVNATPWARVRIDGENRGETPILRLAIAPGVHRIELVNEPLGVRRQLTVTVQPGEHVQRIVDLNAADPVAAP